MNIVAQLLAAKGVDGQAVEELPHLGSAGPEAIARTLRARSLQARIVSLDARDLRHLELPTIVFLKTGDAALLTRAGRWNIELSDDRGNRTRIGRRQFASQFARVALDLSTIQHDASSVLECLLRILIRRRRDLACFCVLTAAVQGAWFAMPLITRRAIDVAIPSGARGMLAFMSLSIALTAAHLGWIEWLRHAAIRAIDANVTASLQRAIIHKIFQLPLKAIERRPIGDFLQCMASAESIGGLTLGEIAVPIVDAVAGISYLLIIALSMPELALCLGMAGAVLALLGMWFGRQYETMQRAILGAAVKQRSLLFEMLEGATTIKTAGLEKKFVSKWIGLLADYQTLLIRQLRRGLRLDVVLDGASHLVLLAMMLWGSFCSLHRDLSIGTMLTVLLLGQAFIHSITRLPPFMILIYRARSDFRRIDELWKDGVGTSQALPSLHAGEIRLTDVWFRHSDTEPWILQNYSLHIPAGEQHLLTGPSGMGKTTLLRLIAGFYPPTRGSISVGGLDASIAGAAVTYLPQQICLIEASILENLVVLSGAPLERIMSAARATGLDEFVNSLPVKYETHLAPSGTNLSGGQRQLVALTACVASERPIVLLDEPFSHIDRLSRKRLATLDLLRDRTVVSVDHEPPAKPRPAPYDSELEVDLGA